MKESKYNIFLRREAITVCYNSFNDNFLVVSNSAYDDYVNSDLFVFSSKYPKIYDSFVANGFLIPDERDELELLRLEHKYEIANSRHMQLTVYPTQDCNLKCWYCYENHVKGSRMSDEVQANIVLFIKKKIERNEFDSINITFLEENLYFHLIK
ncbi:MAG: hypothetical protein LUH63_12310 [Parabacteroides sp.]|nr:hypothetical protein [Parabacteroides sp.]